MARRSRLVVPELPPPGENPGDGEPDVELPAPPDTQLEPQVGDLAELADGRYTDYTFSVWRLRTPEEISRGPKAGPRAWVERIVGPVDITAFQQAHGGGIYEFWAYLDLGDGNGRRLRFKQVIPIDGQRKESVTPSVTPQPSAPAAADAQVNAVLQAINRTLERLEARAAAPAAAVQPFPLKEFVELAKVMRDAGSAPAAPALGGATVGEMMELVNQGIELGKSTQPGNEQSTLGVVLEKVAPSLERLAGALLSRRTPPASRPAAAAVPSSARVVEAEPEAVPPSDDEVRMTAAVDSLARAMVDQTSPDDFAFVLEHILSREQAAMLRLGTVEQIMAQLADGGAIARYPILATDAAGPYLEAVLHRLKNPDEDDQGGE